MFVETVDSPIGRLTIEADENEILNISYNQLLPKNRGNEITRKCILQLSEYFSGERQEFDLPLKIKGTEFQRLVWQELRQVKFGQTCSYSEIAGKIGRPKAQRAVGAANHINRFPIIIPCHRIVGKNKSLVGYALGLDKKIWLLNHERS